MVTSTAKNMLKTKSDWHYYVIIAKHVLRALRKRSQYDISGFCKKKTN